jgi:DNA-binding transcriptional ArsR family regulator
MRIMSAPEEEPYSAIFTSLKHPVRRKILRMLSEKPRSFTEMLEASEVSSSHLTYHLENLGELVSKAGDGKYKLSAFGQAAVATMSKVEEPPRTVGRKRGLLSSLRLKSLLALLTTAIVVLASLNYAQYQSLNKISTDYEPLRELSDMVKNGDLLQSQYTLRYRSSSYISIPPEDAWYCVMFVPYDNSTLNMALTVNSIQIPGYVPITVQKGDALATNETAPTIQSLNTTMSGRYSIQLPSKGWYTISLVGSIVRLTVEKDGGISITYLLALQSSIDCSMSLELIHEGTNSPFAVKR